MEVLSRMTSNAVVSTMYLMPGLGGAGLRGCSHCFPLSHRQLWTCGSLFPVMISPFSSLALSPVLVRSGQYGSGKGDGVA